MRTLSLAFIFAGLVNFAAMADPPQNCISNYFVTDRAGHCAGDILNLQPVLIAHNFENFGLFSINVNAQQGVTDLAAFVLDQPNCRGTVYIPLTNTLPPQAFANQTEALWAPSKTGITVINQVSFQFGPPPNNCFADNQPNVLVAPAQEISFTFVPELVPATDEHPWIAVQTPNFGRSSPAPADR